MPKLKILSGKETIAILGLYDFCVVVQKGSHVKLRRELYGERQTLTIPDHKSLDRGTLHAVFRQASRYVNESELRPHFFTD